MVHGSDGCLIASLIQFCGVTIRTDTSSLSAFALTSLWTTLEVAPWVLSPYAIGAIGKAIGWGRAGYAAWQVGRLAPPPQASAKFVNFAVQQVGKSKAALQSCQLSWMKNANGSLKLINPQKAINYHPRIRIRALQDPSAHNFPYSFDRVILKSNPVLQKDGSLLYRVNGSLNRKSGVFEVALNPETQVIFHRTFRGR